MTQRDKLYRQFGPMLLEALTQVLLEAINELLKSQGLPEMNEHQLIESILNHISELEPYAWMSEQENFPP